jgi:hypothetical protein
MKKIRSKIKIPAKLNRGYGQTHIPSINNFHLGPGSTFNKHTRIQRMGMLKIV